MPLIQATRARQTSAASGSSAPSSSRAGSGWSPTRSPTRSGSSCRPAAAGPAGASRRRACTAPASTRSQVGDVTLHAGHRQPHHLRRPTPSSPSTSPTRARTTRSTSTSSLRIDGGPKPIRVTENVPSVAAGRDRHGLARARHAAAVRHAGDDQRRGQAGARRAEDGQQQRRVRRAVLAAVAVARSLWRRERPDGPGRDRRPVGGRARPPRAHARRRCSPCGSGGCAPPSRSCSAAPGARTSSPTPRGCRRRSGSCTTGSRRSPSGSRRAMAEAEDRLDGAIAYRALVRYDAYGELSGPPVRLARAARRGAQRRRAVLDRPPRHGAAVLQAGHRRARRAPALAGGGRGDPARARGRARLPRCSRTDARRLPRAAGHQLPRRARRRRRWTASRVAFPRVAAVVRAVAGRRGRARRSSRWRTRARAPSGATLDALVFDAPDVRDRRRARPRRARYCLTRRAERDRARRGPHRCTPIRRRSRQCAALPGAQLPGAAIVAEPSTADAVRAVAEGGALAGAAPHAAIGTRHAARLYGATVLPRGSRTTRTTPPASPGSRAPATAPRPAAGPDTRPRSCSGAAATWPPGWLVRLPHRVLLARRSTSPGSSRARGGSGSATTCSSAIWPGRLRDPAVAAAIAGLRAHCEAVRVLGSFPRRG